MTVVPDCVWALGAELGEGPAWSTSSQSLWFVDIKGQMVHCHVPGTNQRNSWAMPGQPGFALPATGGRLVVGMPGALTKFDPQSGTIDLLVTLEVDRPGNRLNDAHVDRAGRLWFGSMDDGETLASGALYCWRKGTVTRHDDGICITNGPAVSPDGRTLYHTDTLAREIHAFELEDDGTTLRKRLFLRFSPDLGWPDGTSVDEAGCLWVAFFGGWAVRRYTPDGHLLSTLRLPCANVTKLAFGGPDLRTAYITTARKGLNARELAEQPLAGGLFAFSSTVAGLPATELDLPDV